MSCRNRSPACCYTPMGYRGVDVFEKYERYQDAIRATTVPEAHEQPALLLNYKYRPWGVSENIIQRNFREKQEALLARLKKQDYEQQLLAERRSKVDVPINYSRRNGLQDLHMRYGGLETKEERLPLPEPEPEDPDKPKIKRRCAALMV